MNQPFLRFLRTTNFKNLSLEKEIELGKINIFIGSNGSGKSNFISCLRFLRDSINNTFYESRGISDFSNAINEMGKILDNTIESPAVVRFEYCFSEFLHTVNNKTNNIVLDIKISVSKKKNSIHNESLYSAEDLYKSDSIFYYYEINQGQGNISIYNTSGENSITNSYEILNNIPTTQLVLSILPELIENIISTPQSIPAYKIRRDLIEFISRWCFYNANNMDLNLIRKSEPKIGGNDIYLSPSGDNLPLVLENLIQENIDFEDSINQAMKSILPKTRRIRPIRSGRLSLTVEWYFENVKEPFYLSEMSDGTVRMLCWATILHSPVLPSLLVIDEPELGLHVSWMRILAEWIKEAARKTQVIVTTHSPDLLDHFTDCLENVYCFYSQDSTHYSIKTLSKEILNPSLEEGWQLGDLYRVGDPNVGGWPW